MNFRLPLNDPAVPVVIQSNKSEPPQSFPTFEVIGYTGNCSNLLEIQACQVNSYICHAAKVVCKYLPTQLNKWAATSNLIINPRAGKQLNAFYDRNGLKFFFLNHPVTQKLVFTCESSDVVSHEFGHAILDSIRPDLWNNPSIEIGAFHESFGDILAILSALNHSEVVKFALLETNGDLKNFNCIARIAEEMGECLASLQPNVKRKKDALRNAINDFKYQEPGSLPLQVSDDRLTRSSHSFSRILTGTFWDLFIASYEYNKDLQASTDEIGKLWFSTITQATLESKFIKKFCNTLINVGNNLPWINKLKEVLENRNLFGEFFIPLAMEENMNHENPQVIKLKDFVSGTNPLYDCEVEVPIAAVAGATEIILDDELIKEAKEGLDQLIIANRVCKNGSSDKEFKVENGKLVRNHFKCY